MHASIHLVWRPRCDLMRVTMEMELMLQRGVAHGMKRMVAKTVILLMVGPIMMALVLLRALVPARCRVLDIRPCKLTGTRLYDFLQSLTRFGLGPYWRSGFCRYTKHVSYNQLIDVHRKLLFYATSSVQMSYSSKIMQMDQPACITNLREILSISISNA